MATQAISKTETKTKTEAEIKAQADIDEVLRLTREWLTADTRLYDFVEDVLARLDKSGDICEDHIEYGFSGPNQKTKLEYVFLVQKQSLVKGFQGEVWARSSSQLCGALMFFRSPIGLDKDGKVHLLNLPLGGACQISYEDWATLGRRHRVIRYHRENDPDFPTERDYILHLHLPDLRDVFRSIKKHGTSILEINDKLRTVL